MGKVQIMKRILKAICMCGMISMFFTGCTSIVTPVEVDPVAVQSSVEASVSAAETSGDGVRVVYGEDSLNQQVPDYFQQCMENKFKDLEGKQAFKIMEGHSGATEDIENFQIGNLRDDGAFVYAYTTRMEKDTMPRRVVHCVASYNYRTEESRVIHENVYPRDWEDENEKTRPGADPEEDKESFYLQMDDSVQGTNWDIFVYDNGEVFVYKNDGTVKLQTEIEPFIRECFAKAYSLSASHAMTDGSNRIYLELAVEKERMNIPENPKAGQELVGKNGKKKEEEEDRKAETEMEEKMANRILVYDFQPLNVTMSQKNDNFDAQAEAWGDMTEGKRFKKEPDVKKDWESAVKSVPDKWGGAILQGLNDCPVYTWKDGPKFQYEEEDYICTFRAEKDSYKVYTDMKENTELSQVFIPYGNHFNMVSGTTGDIEPYDPMPLARSYTYVWTETETDADGNETSVEHEEERWQYLARNCRRRTKLGRAYLEGYWLLGETKITSLSNCIDGQVLCSDGKRAYWLQRDGSLISTGFTMKDDYEPGAFRDGSQVYLMASGVDGMMLARDHSWEDTGASAPGLEKLELTYKDIGETYTRGDSDYDKAFEELSDTYIDDSVDIYGNAGYYTYENILRANLTVDSDLASEIKAQGEDMDAYPSSSSRGLLFTSSAKGLVYYDPQEKRSVTLSKGTWYRSWKQGNTYISVGFVNGDNAYGGMDMAYSRVFEYDLDQLYSDTMRDALKALEEQKKKEEASQSLEGETEEETVKEMIDEWDENHKQKWTKVELETAVSQGETFDSDVFDDTQAERASMLESSREQRMNEILYGTGASGETPYETGGAGQAQ